MARARGYSDRSRLDESGCLRETCKVHPRATISGLLRPAHVAPDPIRRSSAPAPAHLFRPPRTEQASFPLCPAGDARRMARLCHRPSPGDGGLLGVPPQPRPAALFDREAPDGRGALRLLSRAERPPPAEDRDDAGRGPGGAEGQSLRRLLKRRRASRRTCSLNVPTLYVAWSSYPHPASRTRVFAG